MHITLKAWRQAAERRGRFETYDVDDVSPDMSFLEMLDVLNERLIAEGKEPIAFDHDCREGICGSCAMMINGRRTARSAAPRPASCTCASSTTATTSRSSRGARRRSRSSGTSSSTAARSTASSRPAATSPSHRRRARRQPHPGPRRRPSPTPRWTRRRASAAAPAWPPVRTAPRSSSPSAKVQHLNLLPQGQPERWDRTVAMVDTMEEYFGSCTNHGECEAACPKEISIDFIALMNRDYMKAQFKQRRLIGQTFRKPLRDQLQIADETGVLVIAPFGGAQDRGRVDRCDLPRPVRRLEPFAALLGDGNFGPNTAWPAVAPRMPTTSGCTVASSASHHCRHAWISAAFGFLWIRTFAATFELEVLHRVAHVDAVSVEADGFERLVEHFAGRADEGVTARDPPCRRGPHRSARGGASRRPFAEHRLGGVLVEVACGARARARSSSSGGAGNNVTALIPLRSRDHARNPRRFTRRACRAPDAGPRPGPRSSRCRPTAARARIDLER